MAKNLIHTDPKFYNHKLNIPYDGVVQLGPKGEVTVSEQAAKVLLTIPNWVDPEAVTEEEEEIVPETKKKRKKPAKLIFEEETENSGLEGIDLENLDGLEINELLEIAEAAGLDVPAPMRTNKKGLTVFVRNQLKKKLS